MKKYEPEITSGTTSNKSGLWKFIIILVVMIIGAGLVFSVAKDIYTGNQEKIENVFADVNGDGTLDLIVSGNVIYNGGGTSQNLPVSQLSKP